MIVLSTDNPHKLEEIQAVLGADRVLSKSQYGSKVEAFEETANTLEGNAQIKVEAVTLKNPKDVIIGDDTGLFVGALGGDPGVHTARYAGIEASDQENRKKLLDELTGIKNRSAYFKTVIAIRNGEGIHFVEGICRGTILEEERGEGGFGYDAIFVPQGFDKTFAELPLEVKNSMSHRGRALEKLQTFFKNIHL